MARVRPEAYASIASQLWQEELMERIIKGQVPVPDAERSLFNPFPPVLIPVWVNGAQTVIGLWKHWFSDRQPTFVEFYGTTVYGTRNMAFERGRTLKQVIYCHLFECITNRDGVDDEIQSFADSCGISDIDEIDRLSVEGGDVKTLGSHTEFANKEPLSFFEIDNQSDYSGDFPTKSVVSSAAALQHCCVHEIHSGYQNLEPDYTLRKAVAENSASPEWFRTKSQHTIFKQLLNSNNLEGAWMCLNSPDWTLGNARQAITDLAAKANDAAFTALATIWVNLPFEDDEMF